MLPDTSSLQRERLVDEILRIAAGINEEMWQAEALAFFASKCFPNMGQPLLKRVMRAVDLLREAPDKAEFLGKLAHALDEELLLEARSLIDRLPERHREWGKPLVEYQIVRRQSKARPVRATLSAFKALRVPKYFKCYDEEHFNSLYGELRKPYGTLSDRLADLAASSPLEVIGIVHALILLAADMPTHANSIVSAAKQLLPQIHIPSQRVCATFLVAALDKGSYTELVSNARRDLPALPVREQVRICIMASKTLQVPERVDILRYAMSLTSISDGAAKQLAISSIAAELARLESTLERPVESGRDGFQQETDSGRDDESTTFETEADPRIGEGYLAASRDIFTTRESVAGTLEAISGARLNSDESDRVRTIVRLSHHLAAPESDRVLTEELKALPVDVQSDKRVIARSRIYAWLSPSYSEAGVQEYCDALQQAGSLYPSLENAHQVALLEDYEEYSRQIEIESDSDWKAATDSDGPLWTMESIGVDDLLSEQERATLASKKLWKTYRARVVQVLQQRQERIRRSYAELEYLRLERYKRAENALEFIAECSNRFLVFLTQRRLGIAMASNQPGSFRDISGALDGPYNYLTFRRLLRLFSICDRKLLSEAIGRAAGTIGAIGGKEALEGCADAVTEVCDLWP